MKKCSICEIERPEDDFYMYSEHRLRGRIEWEYSCKSCSDMLYGDKWYPIVGYDEICDISDRGTVRELRENRYYCISYVQNASVSYVYLHKNGKKMLKNIRPLKRKFVRKDEK